ncbi:Phytoene synthase [Pseudomassariella vexata]|uniref:Bifunctional lycopene cyclase/phytoene synthase n=1 Tax=Pseudomassariella vexata TaxID=1141098 RepID=A0A1Y2E705_9PEZI|nr:Phytoene synthase [Pseudomassariella vexata]ORY67322.1 Phytoene synthase [Pseudomassariella vexata]
MAYDYVSVHLKFTIPLAGLLTLVLRPLLTKYDLIKTSILIFIAFTATLPWDSYLIRRGVWTYPPDAIVGPRLCSVPAEELFFFVIQTYITSMLYIMLNKPALHSQYLTNRKDSSATVRWVKRFGQALLVGGFAVGAALVRKGGGGTYLGLILVWACPFALLTWSFSGYFIIRLPFTCVVMPILLPTLYLWVVDELALGRGTWSIESGTKLGKCVWGSLELEEAIFFLATNALIVFGMAAFDRAMAVLNTFPELFPGDSRTPTPRQLIQAVLVDPAKYRMDRVVGIREAVSRLRRKSRSFYLASSVFPGRLRIDLILLYAFCRVADDLVDESRTETVAHDWITKLTGYLDLVYSSNDAVAASDAKVQSYVEKNFPASTQSALKLLPTKLLPSEPLYELLEGFKMDLSFSQTGNNGKGPHLPEKYPIRNEDDLQLYASRVASTVGELCLWLVFHHSKTKLSSDKQAVLVQASRTMGHALQYVNIARDIAVDAGMDRVYLPTNWLKEEGLTPRDIIKAPRQAIVENLRGRLLDAAFEEYARSRSTMDMLPKDVRGPMIVAVESYMEIGRVLREKKGVPSSSRPGRATVPRSRRILVAWKVLSSQ